MKILVKSCICVEKTFNKECNRIPAHDQISLRNYGFSFLRVF